MSKIGSLGNVIFCVGRSKTLTFSDLSKSISADYTLHKRINGAPIAEFTNAGSESISLNICLSAFMGVSPSAELKKLEEYTKSGKALTFVLGGEKVGSYRWVITKLSEKYKHIDNRGNILEANVSITLQEYGKR